jgi:hypothetical protein
MDMQSKAVYGGGNTGQRAQKKGSGQICFAEESQ